MSKSKILQYLRASQELATADFGIENILQPGIIKEMIMADILEHELIPQKDSADAKDENGTYEYLASIRRVNVKINKGCSFQMDRVTKYNLQRVTRNKFFYFGIFKNHLEIEQIWKVETPIVLNEVTRQLDKCKNEIAHINFLLGWVEKNGQLVFKID
jgi:hypothetical protein